MSLFIKVIKIRHFGKIHRNIFTFRQRERTSVEVGNPSALHSQQGIAMEEEDVQRCDYRVWTETAKGRGTDM
jgi:hypothetical protein